MAETTRLTGRPQIRERQSVLPTTAARQGDYLSALPRGGELTGLLSGLSAINPRINELRQDEVSKAAKSAEEEALAAAQRHENPREALTGAPLQAPTNVPPAFADDARRIYAGALSARASVKIKADAVQEYHSLKDQPDFNHESWLAKSRARALEGLTDPTAAASIGKSFVELEGLVRQDAEQTRMAKLQLGLNDSMAAITADVATANKTPQELFKGFHETVVPAAKQMGKTRNEAAQLFLGQLSVQSMAAGGVPEVFDAFLEKDADGRSLADYNPALGAQAQQARAQAVQQRDKAIMERTQPANANLLKSYETDLEKDPTKITWERIMGDFGKFGAFSTDREAASMWARTLDAQRRHAAANALENYSGPLFVLEKGIQNKIMDKRLGPMMQQLLATDDPQSIAQLAGQMVTLQSTYKSSIPWDQMKGWVDTLVTTLPSKDGPTPQLLAAAELYKSMSRYPGMREKYFDKEDTSKLLESYIASTNGKGDPKAAYAQAFESISPAAKAAAEAYVKTPEFATLKAKEAPLWAAGAGWLAQKIGWGEVANGTYIGNELQVEMATWRARNPFASEKDAKAYAEQWTRSSFVKDDTTGEAIKIPRELAGEVTGEAISAYTKKHTDRLRLGDRNDSNWRIVMQPVGTEGQYNVMAFGAGALQLVEQVDVRKLVAAHQASKHYTDDEAKKVGAMLANLQKGNYAAVDMALMAKAEALGTVKPEQVRAHRDAMAAAFVERLKASPQMDLGSASAQSLQHVPGRGGRVDPKLTAQAALQLVASPVFGTTGHHMGLAASLTTMGEGMALQAYDDPALNAGRNIGMGYNLKANAATARSDLKRAGVPEERIDEVISGGKALLPEQAQRLLQLTLPRYEKQARDVAEATTPGLWDKRMTAAQKAVLVDIAYQTGDPGQFKRALAALAANDQPAFQAAATVYYTNKAGEKVADTRRNALRASMLAGIPHWESTVQQYGALPANKLAAMALQPK